MGSVDIDHVTKVYEGGDDNIVAIDDVSLRVDDGEFMVFVGPSGSGKSTLLRMIAGLEEVSEGVISLDDEDITNRKPKDRDMAMVFQNYALYPHLPAGENLSFGLRMRGDYSDEEIDRRVQQAAEMLSIEDLLEKMPGELSGGQQQRVSLGRAIVRDPEVFLMDEPLSNLDAKLRVQMRTEIQRLQEDLDVTAIYVTHDQTEAMTMGDRIAILDGGELQQIATPLEAYYRPTNQFVASFIGSPAMNFFDVRVDRSRGMLSVKHEEFTVGIDDDDLDVESGTRLRLGIRPEDVDVTRDRSKDAFEREIDVIEPLGKDQLVYFEVSGEECRTIVDGKRTLVEGETVFLRFPPENIHLFDPESGAAIRNCKLSEERRMEIEA